jgi:catechol 2,3-dioxygenase-like lactoylglutathione lyase family enzyme
VLRLGTGDRPRRSAPGGRRIGQYRPVAHHIAALDHVQLAMPPGGESEADAFYCGILGFTAVAKPEPLASRGGRWYVAAGSVNLHLGVEGEFRPSRKAHPALRVDGFDDLVAALDRSGVAWRSDTDLPGVRRVDVEDPFGNRIELIDAGSPDRDTEGPMGD